MLDNKDFVWTDALALEFAARFDSIGEKIGDSKIYLFKKSKGKDMPKQDWEILSVCGADKETWCCDKNLFDWHLNVCKYSINQVKRLFDGEVFTVGDKTNFDVIERFEVYKDQHMLAHFKNGMLSSHINNLEKDIPKVPLFTCFDGNNNYVGELVYPVKLSDKTLLPPFTTKITTGNISFEHEGYMIYFSTEEKAKDYILLNKPIEVSYSELQKVFSERKRWPDAVLSKDIEKFFKSKINS